MKDSKHRLIIEQLDNKLKVYTPLLNITIPDKGWLHVIRKTYKMSLRQFGERLGVTPPAVEGYEKREKEGSITLKSLEEAGKALNMKLVYGFVPVDGSIEKTIEKRARALALEIVRATSNTMALEDQENTDKRLQKAIDEKTKEIVEEMPRYLWD
ncbi:MULTISPECIES: mobile mystery protein A [Galbibacter]|uniref:Mobile mystery protein A n=1 Tax=Galbibacter pacificus TaxID=2996052 RepID=A0ABT6FRZ4_9FLAO|nr:mobile mystery protein A [Galbibacter pacificus]MDG3582842.1 mobile mystery protein A [Galbibacter pacificus]MDG3586039.1 mobile mystery protein A [Galbibacter pacificus]